MTTKLSRKKISDKEMSTLKIHQMAVIENKSLAVGKKYTVISDSDKVGIDIKCTQNCPYVIKSLSNIKSNDKK